MHHPRKRFGQHFLHDPQVLARIVDAVAPAAGDVMVEIGPGLGALTRPLLERIDRLEAIEIDRDLAAGLQADIAPPRLVVHCADALDVDFARFGPGLRVVGNLPYNVSTPLLFHLVGVVDGLRDLHFMLQREVVTRMAAQLSTPEYGRLSVMIQVYFEVTPLFAVGRGAFRPPPRVDSAVVRLKPRAPERRPAVDAAFLSRVVARAFSARRKKLSNALPLDAEGYAGLGIDPGLRPENLSPEDYVRIARRLARTGAVTDPRD